MPNAFFVAMDRSLSSRSLTLKPMFALNRDLVTDRLPCDRPSLTVKGALKSLATLLLAGVPLYPCPSKVFRSASFRTLAPTRMASRLTTSEFNDRSIRWDHADRLPGQSFYTTNEARHYIWHDRVQNLGGIMIGIATHQNYILAGWARPERLILMDFDINVVLLHKAYRVCFEIARTPWEFVFLWDEEYLPQLEQAIWHAYGNDVNYNFIIAIVHNERETIFRHLQNTRTIHRAGNLSSFLTNQSQYDFVANLSRMGYVTPVCGDVFGNNTLRDIASVARKTNLPVRLLYLSNLEDHFGYKGRFRDNLMNLPFDSRSLVLRTSFPKIWENKFNKTTTREGTHYCTQRASDLLAWLHQPRTQHISDIFEAERISLVSSESTQAKVLDTLRQRYTVGKDVEFTCFVLSSPVEHVLGHPKESSS